MSQGMEYGRFNSCTVGVWVSSQKSKRTRVYPSIRVRTQDSASCIG